MIVYRPIFSRDICFLLLGNKFLDLDSDSFMCDGKADFWYPNTLVLEYEDIKLTGVSQKYIDKKLSKANKQIRQTFNHFDEQDSLGGLILYNESALSLSSVQLCKFIRSSVKRNAFRALSFVVVYSPWDRDNHLFAVYRCLPNQPLATDEIKDRTTAVLLNLGSMYKRTVKVESWRRLGGYANNAALVIK